MKTSSKNAFSLTEITIVVAIIAFLASIAIPNFNRARARAVNYSKTQEITKSKKEVAMSAIEDKFDHKINSFEVVKMYHESDGQWMFVVSFRKDGSSIIHTADVREGVIINLDGQPQK